MVELPPSSRPAPYGDPARAGRTVDEALLVPGSSELKGEASGSEGRGMVDILRG